MCYSNFIFKKKSYMIHLQTFQVISFGLVNEVALDIFLHQEMYNIYERNKCVICLIEFYTCLLKNFVAYGNSVCSQSYMQG